MHRYSSSGTQAAHGSAPGRARRWAGLAGRLAAGQRRGDDFTRAYALGIAQRLPLLYLVVVFDLVLLAFAMRDTAPLWLEATGLVLVAYGFVRALYWLPSRVAARPVERQRADLDRMAWLGAASGLAFVGWSLALYSFGNADQRALIELILSVTMFTGILGLGHAPRTSLALAAVYAIPSTLYLAWQGHPGVAYIALVQIGVTGMLLLVAQGYHRDFVRLELSRQQLVRRERQAARLARAHYRQATVDALTGGLNRRGVLGRVEAALHLSSTQESRPRPWLALADLDGFKHINDTYGHAAGDAVLCAMSRRIADARGILTHGRLGGDEFALMLDPAFDSRAALAACRRLSLAIREPIEHNGATLRVCASIGLYRIGKDSVSACLERADAALYKAKGLGDGAICLFGADDERALQQRIAITRQFNDCALDERLRLLYQPIVDQTDNRILGFEAFARWSPDGANWHSPGSFMAIAEATGRTGELTRLVLARALAECRPGAGGFTLSVNLSPRDLLREGAVEAIAGVVADAGESPASVILEITERAVMTDPRRATAQLQAFRDHGFRIALDDFGAGWSSLSHLRQLPLDFVKLDPELAAALPVDPGARAVAGMIVALAWQLGIVCTLEGVEGAAQADAARDLGIKLVQGYHFGRPEPAETALAVVRSAVA